MKRIIAFLLALSLAVLFCACTLHSELNTISYNDDGTEMYYNGYTYINYNNYNGKYRFDFEKDTDNLVKIATTPYGFFYILGAVTVYYGNNVENPDYITNSRSRDFYVREDVTIDHSLMLSACDMEEPFRFRITEVITGDVITYNFDKRLDYQEICNFFATFENYPGVQIGISILEYNGKLYLQDVWDSDYYEITDSFKEDLYRYSIDAFDYAARGSLETE